MTTTKMFRKQILPVGGNTLTMFVAAITFTCLLTECYGQGTFTFEGQPVGTAQQLGGYTASGMRFRAIQPGSLYLSGGGIAGYPDNGTGYLYMPDGNLGGLSFGFTNFLPSIYFNLVSFDAAEYAGAGPTTLTVVGYPGMATPVTNYFTLDGINDGTGPLQDFQTFYLDSSFTQVGRVEVLKARWSLDNLVISGVPEPSSGALFVLGIFSALGWSRMRQKSLSQS